MNCTPQHGLNIGKRATKAGMALALISTLANCTTLDPTGPSRTLVKYTEDQIIRCQESLSIKEQDEIVRNSVASNNAKLLIPILGPLTIDGPEEYYKEAEKICKRKGIL